MGKMLGDFIIIFFFPFFLYFFFFFFSLFYFSLGKFLNFLIQCILYPYDACSSFHVIFTGRTLYPGGEYCLNKEGILNKRKKAYTT